jgi:radical SAM superfamily enzyme YgiQ (UPF0313 family)
MGIDAQRPGGCTAPAHAVETALHRLEYDMPHDTTTGAPKGRVALIEAGSPGLNIYSHVAMGRGVALLATVLRDHGYDVRAFIEDVGGKDEIDWGYVGTADVIGFSSITCTLPRTGDLVVRARAINPSATILFGGPEPTCEPRRSLDLGADFVLRGEAEITLPRLLAALLEGTEPLAEIPGLTWLEEGGLREGPPTRQLTRAELDALPLVDRSLIHRAEHADVAAVWRARGCPSRCDFCEVCEIWPRYAVRSDQHSLDELLAAQQAGYATAFLIDDNAAANKPAFMDFLRAASTRGFAQMLVTQLRADSVFTPDGKIDKAFLRLLKRVAAVTVVCVGVESAADEDLSRVHKNTDASRTARALKAMKRHGLLVHGMFIAFKEDTAEVIKRNGEYARKYVTSLQYLFETPLPGTKRTAQHEAAGSLMFDDVADLSLYDGMHVVLRPEKMGAPEMQQLVDEAYRRFYSTRRIVIAALHGTFGRFHRLSQAQRAYLARLKMGARIKAWTWFHIEYKFAPVGFLAIGRRRIREMMRDTEYTSYLTRIGSM